MSLEQYICNFDEPLKQGGMCSIYLALEKGTGREVILKEFNFNSQSPDENSQLARSFEVEAHSLSRLVHDGIPTIYAHFIENNKGYLVQEYVKGENLEELLNSRSISQEQAVKYAIEVAKILDYCHSMNVIQRDVNPKNIILTPEGKLKLVDFGIALQKNNKQVTQLFTANVAPYGTPGFAAPEQYLQKQDADPRIDIYGLGATLYKLLTKNNPPESIALALGQEKLDKIPDIDNRSKELQEFIDKAMSARPEDRYNNMVKVIEGLENIMLIDPSANPETVDFLNGSWQHFYYGLTMGSCSLSHNLLPENHKTKAPVTKKSKVSNAVGGLLGYTCIFAGSILYTAVDPSYLLIPAASLGAGLLGFFTTKKKKKGKAPRTDEPQELIVVSKDEMFRDDAKILETVNIIPIKNKPLH